MPSPVLIFDSEDLSDYTCYLARGISKYRDVIIYCLSEASYYETGLFNEDRVKFNYLKRRLPKGYSTMKGIVRAAILFFLLSIILAKTKYEIVHIQENLPMFFFFIPFLKLRKKKIFWTIHDVEIFAPSKSIHGKLQVLFTKAVCQRNILTKYVDAIIVHAQSLKERLIAKKIVKDKIHVVYHFDYMYLLKNNRNKLSVESIGKQISNQSVPSNGYALFFGSVAPWKGMDVLMEAASKVYDQIGSIFNLVIAGTPPEGYHSHFDKLLKGSQGHIHVINKYIENNEIPDIINNSKFLILPYNNSFKDSVSGVIPLAYTFSKPVIVSNVPTLSEYVDHNQTGFVFESGNSTQLAKYIKDLIQNEHNCEEMGKKAYQKLLNQMSLEVCCKKINDIYHLSKNK